jgi:hypothetical protein
MYLTIDNNSEELKIHNPDWTQVEQSLLKIDSMTNCYLILTSESESYIQCAGSKEKLTIEIRENSCDTVRHYVLGKGEVKSPLRTIWQIIECRVGPIRVHDNEVLNVMDALTAFKSFFEKSIVLTEYKKRNVTKEHQR